MTKEKALHERASELEQVQRQLRRDFYARNRKIRLPRDLRGFRVRVRKQPSKGGPRVTVRRRRSNQA